MAADYQKLTHEALVNETPITQPENKQTLENLVKSQRELRIGNKTPLSQISQALQSKFPQYKTMGELAAKEFQLEDAIKDKDLKTVQEMAKRGDIDLLQTQNWFTVHFYEQNEEEPSSLSFMESILEPRSELLLQRTRQESTMMEPTLKKELDLEEIELAEKVAEKNTSEMKEKLDTASKSDTVSKSVPEMKEKLEDSIEQSQEMVIEDGKIYREDFILCEYHPFRLVVMVNSSQMAEFILKEKPAVFTFECGNVTVTTNASNATNATNTTNKLEILDPHPFVHYLVEVCKNFKKGEKDKEEAMHILKLIVGAGTVPSNLSTNGALSPSDSKEVYWEIIDGYLNEAAQCAGLEDKQKMEIRQHIEKCLPKNLVQKNVAQNNGVQKTAVMMVPQFTQAMGAKPNSKGHAPSNGQATSNGQTNSPAKKTSSSLKGC